MAKEKREEKASDVKGYRCVVWYIYKDDETKVGIDGLARLDIIVIKSDRIG